MTVTTDRGAAAKSVAQAVPRQSARTGAVEQLSRADRVARGKDARTAAPLESHAEFRPGRGRDPVGLLLGQAASRVPELVPVRHGRMLVSPFTYYRGAARPMAADLAGTPAAGLRVQLCGDAHLSNFGAFASPERNLVFDVNDFDETLPGPFEWDVKRLAASLIVAGRDNGFTAKASRKLALAAAEGYRTAMRGFAQQPFLDVWYATMDVEPALAEVRSQIKAKRVKVFEKLLAKARTKDSTSALAKLTAEVNGERRIISDPPTIVRPPSPAARPRPSPRSKGRGHGRPPDAGRRRCRAKHGTVRDDHERYRTERETRRRPKLGGCLFCGLPSRK
jgi:hypothetical protein